MEKLITSLPWIIHILMTLIPLAFIGVGVLLGIRYKWKFSLSKIIIIIVSVVLSALISLGISSLIAHLLCDMLVDMGVLGEFVDLINEVESVKETLCAFASMIFTPIFYLPIFFILRGGLGLLNRLLITKYYLELDKGEKKRIKTSEKNPIGMVVGGVCGLFLCSAVMIPAACGLSVFGKMAHMIIPAISDEELVENVDHIADAAEWNTSSVIVTATGGKLAYNMMTSYKVMDTRVTLNNEVEFLGAIEETLISAADESSSNELRAKAVRHIATAFSHSDAFPMIAVDVIKTAEYDWDHGKEFCGIEKPSFGKDHAAITDIFLECIERSDYDTVKQDVSDVAEVLAIIIENDRWENIKYEPVNFIADEEITEQILYICLENGRMYPAIDDIVDFGVYELFVSFGAYETKEDAYLAMIEDVEALAGMGYDEDTLKYKMKRAVRDHGIEIDEALVEGTTFSYMNGAQLLSWVSDNVASSAEDFAAKTSIVTSDEIEDGEAKLKDPHKEAKAIAHVLSTSVDLINHMTDSNIKVSDMIKDLGPILDAMAATETFGHEKTSLVLKGILQSEKVYGEIGFTMLQASAIADVVVKNGTESGYTSLLLSLGQSVEVISNATENNKIDDAVKELVTDMTPGSAEVISALVTTETMENYGVPESSADEVSKLISDVMTNLSDAKDDGSMTEDKYEQEAAAVTDMMNLLLSQNDTTFGEDGATKVDVDAYVDNIIASDVVSGTLVDTVYGDGNTPTVDPLNTERVLTEEETQAVEDYLNEKWAALSDEEKADADTEKTFVAIASIINLEANVTAGGIQIVK